MAVRTGSTGEHPLERGAEPERAAWASRRGTPAVARDALLLRDADSPISIRAPV